MIVMINLSITLHSMHKAKFTHSWERWTCFLSCRGSATFITLFSWLQIEKRTTRFPPFFQPCYFCFQLSILIFCMFILTCWSILFLTHSTSTHPYISLGAFWTLTSLHYPLLKISVWRTIHDFDVLRFIFKIIFEMKYFHSCLLYTSRCV